MKEVILRVYDVTNGGSEKTNNTILQINRNFKDRIGLGGVFHSAVQLPQAKTEIVIASKVAYRFIAGLASNSNSSATPESPGNSNRSSSRFQGTWFRNLLSVGAKPSSSDSEVPEGDNDILPLQQQKSMEQHVLSSKHNI